MEGSDSHMIMFAIWKIHITYKYAKKDWSGIVNILEILEKDDEIIIYMFKFTGDIVAGLETYPEDGFLLAFSFKKKPAWGQGF